jgi:triacylglycerol lipase
VIPNLVTQGLAGLGNQRSAGIKDLRFGYLLEEDWKGQNPDALLKDNRHPVPLLEGVDYYIITASLAKDSGNPFLQYFGDGLVPKRSATGKSLFKSKTLPFLTEHVTTIAGITHPALTHDDKVYRQIKQWCH